MSNSHSRGVAHTRARMASRTLAIAGAIAVAFGASLARAQAPVTSCDMIGIGATTLIADGPQVTIESVSAESASNATATVPYCLVKVLVPQAIHIWVGLPLDGAWNGRWQSLGGGGYAGSVSKPTAAVLGGYAGATTDTGHTGSDGSFGMTTTPSPGPNIPLQVDFAYRSEHLMAVIGKQLVAAFYGQKPVYSYWNGCSTGGRQGLRMAQDFPGDYDGILAGAPAIHWDRFQAGQIWPQVAMLRDNGAAGSISTAKETLATNAAIAACDARDGVADGVLTDPRMCTYSAAADASITKRGCASSDDTCLSPGEASAIDKMWQGPVSCAAGFAGGSCPVPDFATRNMNGKGNKRLWYGQMRGTALSGLGGANPFPIAIAQPRYWVYFDPTWDFRVLDYDNYLGFFNDTVNMVGPLMASDDPDLSAFRDHGGKLVMWHGFADQLIVPQGSIDYYDDVVQALHGGYAKTQQFARLFMAPGVGHCGGGAGPQPQGLFDAVVNWVEHDHAPQTILAAKKLPDGTTQTRPLCPYPTFAVWTGSGSTDDAANFVCGNLDPGNAR